jgi:ATP-dependent DNA ligase
MHVVGGVERMLARVVERLPRSGSGGWLFEPKWDGFRAVARVGGDKRVWLVSRRGRGLSGGFPEVVAAVGEHLSAGTVADGEIVRWSQRGRLDFGALQRRLGAGRRAGELARVQPCHYVVFDVLETADRGDVRGWPLWARRRVLAGLFAHVPSVSRLTLGMQTADRATGRGVV